MTYDSHSVADTERIAADLAVTLPPGTVIALDGELGAGKTQFTRGLVRALGGDPRSVSSPTYVLLHVYPTPTLTLYHLDAYRVHGPADFEQIGFEELLDQAGIVVIEWASRVRDLLPKRHIRVDIAATDENARQIVIEEISH